MNTRACVAALFVLGAVTTAVARSGDWTTIKPQTTSQAELTATFGPPDEVVATFPWSEWSATWKKRPASSIYVLRYTRQSSHSKLLDGPAGPADSVDVTIALKKVLSVEWFYGGPSARSAAATLRADAQLKPAERESLLRTAKDVPGGWLSVEVGPDDSSVRLVLMMK